jgi:hypothetical protein
MQPARRFDPGGMQEPIAHPAQKPTLKMNSTTTARLRTLSSAVLALTLSACGGGSDSSSAGSNPPAAPAPAPAPDTTVTGTAATGAAVQGTVVAIDVNGKVSSAATTNSSTGAYTLDVSGMTAPFLLTITGSSGGRLVALTSVATAAGQTVNLTPLTDLIVAAASGSATGNGLVDACTLASGSTTVSAACTDALKAATTGTKLKDAATQVAAMIGPLNTTGTDPLNGSFVANGLGMDGVLDRILVAPDASGQATVTLVATHDTIGQITTGGTLTVTAPTTSQVSAADKVAQVLPEINACLASLSALYPSTGFTKPTAGQVSPFIDPGFNSFSAAQADVVALLTSGEAPFNAGLTVKATDLARRDLSPMSASEIAILTDQTTTNKVSTILNARANGGSPVILDGTGNPTSAWVLMEVSSGGMSGEPQRFVKGPASTGCPGGWRWAGAQHLDMHMAARVARNESASTLTRERAFHIERGAVADEVAAGFMVDVSTVDVRGPGIVAYSGTVSAPVGASTKLTLNRSADPFQNTYVIGNGTGFYGTREALQSCPDVAAANAPTGTPCIDESQVRPGSIYAWALKAASNGPVVKAFFYEVNAVPLSKSFAQANAGNLFATITSITPASVAAVNTAIAGASGSLLDGVFGISYTQGSAYGSMADNCNISLVNAAGNTLLRAEANAVGQEAQCSFNTPKLNSGALDKPANADPTVANGWISVATQVLGNQITTGRDLPKP